jgi:hypothetical protein
MAAWPNGKALDYDFGSSSRDCRFDPCRGHYEFNNFFISSEIVKPFVSGLEQITAIEARLAITIGQKYHK